ncbi:MAG: hypothetical protein RIQ47_713 [Bacteroidota bacterium]|jgi:hypothetical protein
MKHTIYFLLLIALFSVKSAFGAVTPTVVSPLPAQIDESSGLVSDLNGMNWSHNDGYGDNRIYGFSNTGVLSRTVTVSNAVNTDWEDITHDAGFNHMFIGDFGNNACSRTNLKIFRIPFPTASSSSTVTADVIQFSYPDQQQFPSAWMNFDAEAFMHHNGYLYIFSKPDGIAVGYTKLYRVPAQPGNYVATLVDSFYTNDRPTSVAINSDGSAVVLIAVSRIHLFQNWTGDNFFSGQHTQINFGGVYTQKEAVSFRTLSEITLTDENNGTGNFLYSINLAPFITSPTSTSGNSPSESVGVDKVVVFPNPASDFINIRAIQTKDNDVLFELFDVLGNLVKSVTLPAMIGLRMDVSALPNGTYYYRVTDNNRELMTKRLVISR